MRSTLDTYRLEPDFKAGLVAILAVLGAIVTVWADLRPTGSSTIDAVMVFIGAAVVIVMAASAPAWLAIAACVVGACIALDPLIVVVGAGGAALGTTEAIRTRHVSPVDPLVRAAVGAVGVNVLARSELGGFLGLSALVGMLLSVLIVVVGMGRRSSRTAVVGWMAIGVVCLGVVASVIGVGLAGAAARDDLTSAASLSRDAADALTDGEYAVAADLFAESSAGFSEATDELNGTLATGGRFVPGLAQNLHAGVELSASAANATAEAAAALREIDPDALRVVAGTINVDAVRRIEAPLRRVQAALDELRLVSDEVDSPWLVGPLRDELAELQTEFDESEPKLANAIDAVRLAPQMLGGDGPRRYLVLFTTPSEARGLGGFVGNYAEIAMIRGRITVTDFDRRSELEDAVREGSAFCLDCPEELLKAYGRFGLTTGPNEGMGERGWSNITMPAHFPYVAQSSAVLYEQSGGNAVDGVIVMDPYVLETLMQYTGPVAVPELGVLIDAEDAAAFVLRDQYVLAGDDANPERIDALGSLGEQVINRLLSTSLPDPPELASDIGSLVEDRRVLIWTADPEEQDLLDRVGLLGSLPPLGDAGGFSVSVNNAGANKIDAYLERTTDVRVVVGPDRERRLLADVTFRNGAPSSGLPQYVIGNLVDLPDGYSRMLVTFYGPDGLDVALIDGVPIELEPGTEAGWTTHRHFVELAPGQSATYHLEFVLGPRGESTDEPTVWEQPLAELG